MGVVHKLKPEVRVFIKEQKSLNPSLSCRAFTLLITEKLKIKVSKSSINAIFREAGLSMPIGRRVKHEKQKAETLGDRVKLVLQGPVAKQPPALILPEAQQDPQERQQQEQLLTRSIGAQNWRERTY